MPKTYFTDEENITVAEMHAKFYSLAEIAEKLGKSEGSIQQKVYRLKLPNRNNNLVRMVQFYGRDALKHGTTPEAIRRGIAEIKALPMEEKQKRREAAVRQMMHDLEAGMGRNKTIIKAHRAGATMVQIGSVVGMTKQGVSLIIKG